MISVNQPGTCWSLACSSDFAARSSSICRMASCDGVSWPFCNWTTHQHGAQTWFYSMYV